MNYQPRLVLLSAKRPTRFRIRLFASSRVAVCSASTFRVHSAASKQAWLPTPAPCAKSLQPMHLWP